MSEPKKTPTLEQMEQYRHAHRCYLGAKFAATNNDTDMEHALGGLNCLQSLLSASQKGGHSSYAAQIQEDIDATEAQYNRLVGVQKAHNELLERTFKNLQEAGTVVGIGIVKVS